MTECACQLEDGHLVPCPVAEALYEDVVAQGCTDVSGDPLTRVPEAVARRAYEDHLLVAALRLLQEARKAYLVPPDRWVVKND